MILLITGGLFFSSILLLLTMLLAIKITSLILILLSTTYFVMNVALINLPWSWQLVAINKAGECKLTQKNGASFVVHIKPDSFVSAYLAILHVVPEEFRWFNIWQHRYVILLQDNTDADSFRKLRVYLHWHKNIVKSSSNSMH
jgi:hypothetical protein